MKILKFFHSYLLQKSYFCSFWLQKELVSLMLYDFPYCSYFWFEFAFQFVLSWWINMITLITRSPKQTFHMAAFHYKVINNPKSIDIMRTYFIFKSRNWLRWSFCINDIDDIKLSILTTFEQLLSFKNIRVSWRSWFMTYQSMS